MRPGLPISGTVEAVVSMLLTSWTLVTLGGIDGVAVTDNEFVASTAKTGDTASKARKRAWYDIVRCLMTIENGWTEQWH